MALKEITPDCNDCDKFAHTGHSLAMCDLSNDDQFDHIIDSARDHKIAVIIDDDMVSFVYLTEALKDWLKSFNLYDNAEIDELYYIDTSRSTD